MSYRVSMDVGGTFTDVVVADEDGQLTIGKGLTDSSRMFRGMEVGLELCAEQLGEAGVGSLLTRADVVMFSTTRATNAILEGKTAPTAFLVTEGFADTLVLREGGKGNAYDFRTAYPPPYVPRRLTFELRERIDAQGEVVIPLDETHARDVLRQIGEQDVQALGVCLLWSIANPRHELTVAELIGEELPGVAYTISHDLNPIIREYRRASSTVIDASLKPVMQEHLHEMTRDLRAAGFTGAILAATSAGGVIDIEALAERPINAVRSGPALAPVAALEHARAETGGSDVITCDMGGTSFDVSLVRDGIVKSTRETWLGGQWRGHMTGLSSVDVRSIGTGGGSVAWIDEGGLLRVGPKSAGANPGPACYGRGGDQPTVTDAAAFLGYLDPDYFAGGRIKLDLDATHRVIGTLADRLGEDLEQTALAILTVASQAMVRAIQEITVNEGLDPQESLLVAGGGAAGLSIGSIAREMGCRELLIPWTASVLSASGAQHSDIVAEFSRSHFAHSGNFDTEAVNETLASIDEKAAAARQQLGAHGVKESRMDYFVEARYPEQAWELEVRLSTGRFETAEDVSTMEAAFHRLHERVFAVSEVSSPIECLYWKGRLTGVLDRPVREVTAVDGAVSRIEAQGFRQAYFPPAGWQRVPIHLGHEVPSGAVIEGPAIVQEATTTIVVDPGARAHRTARGHYLMQLGS
jgi:N-methylhydantoinase A